MDRRGSGTAHLVTPRSGASLVPFGHDEQIQAHPAPGAVEKVDGQRVSIWSQERLLVDPGTRVLSVAGTYVGGFGGRDGGRVELTATLKAGHTYVLKAEFIDKLMTLWLEDSDTHELASERRTSNTTHWTQWLW